MSSTVTLTLPFLQRSRVGNSPAQRIPSHGADLFGQRYAIDFVGVDEQHRAAQARDWRTFLATEPPERFFAYGRPILAPASGVVVRMHDGERDHAARRSQLALLPYALGQASRLRRGVEAVAGNYVVIADRDSGAFVALAHLRAGSLLVRVGDDVTSGRQVAECGNSGNSTQPHLHLQVMDGPDPATARGVPLAFRNFREWPRGGASFYDRASGLPDNGAVIEPLPAASRDAG